MVNNTFPINPPTIGVATLDGLNQYGLPYNSTTGTGGQADYLTSNQIDLSPYSPSLSDSIYLSFFFEPGGQGDYPGVGDSLVVEILDQGGFWQQLWVDTGYIDSVPDTFQQVLLQIPYSDSLYTFFHSGFQFRFRNVVSLYGLNNMWHIDYVKLGRNRSATDTVINDIAFQFPFPTVLKNFTLEPGPQVNFPADLADSIVFPVRNLGQSAPATSYQGFANELYPIPQLVSSLPIHAFNGNAYDTLTIYPVSQYTNLPSAGVDSLVLNSQIFIEPTVDVLYINDTISQKQIFSNIMAYDDGSAEKAFGLTGGDDVKKFAYEFDLNRPDTLVGFQIMFTQAEANVSNLVFDFDIWDTLKLNSYVWMDTPLVSLVNQIPYYIDSMNGFTTYLLDTQYILSNKVYIGWDQTDSRRLQVGYDMNDTLGHPHMFTYFSGKWDSAYMQPAGSPMIRLIFGHYYGTNSIPSAIMDFTNNSNTLDVFPNPTNGMVYLKSTPANAAYSIEVYNSIGQQVANLPSVTNQLDLGNVANGVYLLNARNIQTGETFHKRIIKTSPR